MIRRKQSARKTQRHQQRKASRQKNATLFKKLVDWFFSPSELFTKKQFHGNTKWIAQQLLAQALMWSWQEAKHVTDAFGHAQEVCEELGMKHIAQSYTSMMNALDRYREVFIPVLRDRYQRLAKEVGGSYFHDGPWVLIGFDGSRATAPSALTTLEPQLLVMTKHSNGFERTCVLRSELWQGETGKVRKEEIEGNATQAESREPTTPPIASSLDHHDVAYAASPAVDLAAGPFEFKRTGPCDGNA